MNHYATPDFWYHYRRLPQEVQRTADGPYGMRSAEQPCRVSKYRFEDAAGAGSGHF
jgi:hypothetical protein